MHLEAGVEHLEAAVHSLPTIEVRSSDKERRANLDPTCMAGEGDR